MNLRRHRRDELKIELTPLIDVVFLLLIFFMVSTTFDKTNKLAVQLPEASSEPTLETKQERIEITVDAKGQLYLNEQELVNTDLDTVRRTLQKATLKNPEIPILVSADKSAPFQAVITLMDAAAELDLAQLQFVTREPAEE